MFKQQAGNFGFKTCFFYILKCTQCYIQNGNNELLIEADFSCINDKFKKDNPQKKIKHLAAKICCFTFAIYSNYTFFLLAILFKVLIPNIHTFFLSRANLFNRACSSCVSFGGKMPIISNYYHMLALAEFDFDFVI